MNEKLLDTKKQLIDKLKNTEDSLANIRKDIKTKESELWLNTKFKEVGCTNEETRRAYVNNNLSDLKFNENLIRNEVNKLKRELNLVDDKIRLFTF